MVTLIIQLRIDILPTSLVRPLVAELHVHRHVEPALAHILAVPLHVRERRLDLPLVPRPVHGLVLVVELEHHRLHAVENGVRGEAHLVAGCEDWSAGSRPTGPGSHSVIHVGLVLKWGALSQNSSLRFM